MAPFNVKLYFDDDSSEEQSFSFYSSDSSKITVRCAADSFQGAIKYEIRDPHMKVYYEEQIILDRIDEKRHVGIWTCSAKNAHGTADSNPIHIKLLNEKPSIPMIKINHIINSSNSFSVDNIENIVVNCIVISNKPNDDHSLIYSLQLINSGSKYNITKNKFGVFNVNFDESYSENIYSCRAENDIGISSPAIFYLYKTHATGNFQFLNIFI